MYVPFRNIARNGLAPNICKGFRAQLVVVGSIFFFSLRRKNLSYVEIIFVPDSWIIVRKFRGGISVCKGELGRCVVQVGPVQWDDRSFGGS